MSKKLKIFIVVDTLVVLVLLLPASNLVSGLPSGTALTKAFGPDAPQAKVAATLEGKCAYCHVPEVAPPFYASLPIAGSMVKADVAKGLRYFDLVRELALVDGAPVSAAALAKLEREIEQGSMPPGPFKLMHWNGSLDSAEESEVLSWLRAQRAEHHAPPGIEPALAAGPFYPLPEKVDHDPAKAALGARLYNDQRLSGDDTLSCASCHALDKGGTDQAKVSTGIRDQKGGINAPTTFNAVFQVKQFWDGRAATLEEQADGPPNNPIEMGSNWPEIIGKLEQDADFVAAFTQAFPDGLSAKNINHAVAEFERTLLTPNARFDQYLRGAKQALTADELRGKQQFVDRGCATCHTGVLLGGSSFELMGRSADYFAARGDLTAADDGRYAVTKDPYDRRRFKVPTLRNVEKTFPYFHDGSTADLGEAVQIMARYNLGIELGETERTGMVAFLGSLTGEYQGQPL